MAPKNEESIVYVPLQKIRNGNIRKRFTEAELDELKQSMVEVGQLQPVRLRPVGELFDAIDGGRRIICARGLSWETIAAIIEQPSLSDAEAKQRALISNCQRCDLSPFEIADTVQELMSETGWSATSTATKLGFSTAKLSKLLPLLKLPEPIREYIREGKIPASAGYELSRIEDAAQQLTLAERMAQGQLTRDSLSGITKRRRTPNTGKPANGCPRVTVALGNGRTVTVAGAALTSLDALIALLEELLAKARKCRPKGHELGTFIRILRDEAKAT